MITHSAISPRVMRILGLIQRLEPQERSQLGQLLPSDVISAPEPGEALLSQAMTYFQEKRQQYSTESSSNDPYEGDLQELYRFILEFMEHRQSSPEGSLLVNLTQIKIDGPPDFGANHDLYLTGLKDD